MMLSEAEHPTMPILVHLSLMLLDDSVYVR